MSTRTPWLAVFAFAATALLSSCSGGGGGSGEPLAREFDAGVAVAWFEQLRTLIKETPGFSPPVASRALGYAGVTLYEAIVPGMPDYASLGGVLNGLPPLPSPDAFGTPSYSWPLVANAALAAITRELFPNASTANRSAIDALEAANEALYQPTVDADVYAASLARGREVAQAIVSWSLNDGGAFGYLTNGSPGYVPPTGPGLWVPTPPAFANALQANWGANRCFAIPAGDSCQPGSPPAYSTDPASKFYAEGLEVYQTTQNLSTEQVAIANFWADNPGQTSTPPGHWVSIVGQILNRDGLSLEVAAESYAKVGIAVADAFIACWNCKFRYSLLRPITYIQQNIDPQWTPLLATPPFPEYTSGHSVQSGAVAKVLTGIFGENFAFTDDTHAALGYPARTFPSFYAAADEAAISRLYGGIHFRSAIDLGVVMGRTIGNVVDALPFKAGSGASPSTPATSYPGDVANAWFDLARDLVKTTPGFSPPVASRAFGYTGLALYESIVPGMPGYVSLSRQVTGLTELPRQVPGAVYHGPTVANAALARVARSLWTSTSATNLAAIDALEQTNATAFQAQVPPDVYDRSVIRGREVADTVFYYSRTDGGHEGYASNFPASYVPPVGPGLWVPTAPAFSAALQPFWGQNRLFSASDVQSTDPGPPPPFSTTPGSLFYVQADEVYQTTNNLSAEQSTIAQWWADNAGQTSTPPGHSISLTAIALRATNANLALAAEAYAKVGIAVSDAFVSCWAAKYRYNLLRPITYIQQNIDPQWVPPLATPPFPEYTSGHSVQSGASAEVLTDLFGAAFPFIDDTNVGLGLAPRTFTSFFEAANEAAISRLYGGIHFRAAIDIGVQQGRAVGKLVNALSFRAAP